jgi:hypothetical protein
LDAERDQERANADVVEDDDSDSPKRRGPVRSLGDPKVEAPDRRSYALGHVKERHQLRIIAAAAEGLDVVFLLYYVYSVGRPRKSLEDRLTRTITARLQDEQYDWLVERAIDNEGDLSKGLREAIDLARLLERVLAAGDPVAELKEVLRRSEEETAREEADLA